MGQMTLSHCFGFTATHYCFGSVSQLSSVSTPFTAPQSRVVPAQLACSWLFMAWLCAPTSHNGKPYRTIMVVRSPKYQLSRNLS